MLNDLAVERLLMAQGIDPARLKDAGPAEKALMRAIGRYGVPTVALHAPVASDTWMVMTDMATTDEETGRQPIAFPAACIVVGLNPVVTPIAFEDDAGVRIPSPDDILVSIDLDKKNVITTRDGTIAATIGGRDAQFCTLAGISVFVPRLMMLMLDTATPRIGFTFRSRYATQGASNLPACRISVDVFTKPLGW